MIYAVCHVPVVDGGLGRGITPLLSDELGVFQAFSDDALHGSNAKPALVGVLSLVESERLLIAVSEQMKRLNVHVSSFQASLEQRPEVFKAVRVDVAFRVALKMVYNLAVVIFRQIVIGHERIGVHRRTFQHILADIAAKLRAPRRFNNL